MSHSIILTDIAVILLLVLVMRRTRAKPTPAIHIHPCITIPSAADLTPNKEGILAVVRESAGSAG